jgi:hypothetical protein
MKSRNDSAEGGTIMSLELKAKIRSIGSRLEQLRGYL